MSQRYVYRPPLPSKATRQVIRRSRASCRGTIVWKLPADPWPRMIHFESWLEYLVLCLLLVQHDPYDVWEQPPAISYIDPRGRPSTHYFDFLVTLRNGTKLAVTVKPMKHVKKYSFVRELECIRAATPKQYADKVFLVTDKQVDPKAARDAARQLYAQRHQMVKALV